jgi:uncharacterized protein YdeI (YjbR/CyaY-like superfamily)
MKSIQNELPEILFETQKDWSDWLEQNQAASTGVWLKMAKKASGLKSINYNEAVEVALCYGWIDGQSKSLDELTWKQKFTPRGPKSIWSKVNRAKVDALTSKGLMKPSGLLAVERAKQDGRWEAAYDSPSNSSVPDDFQAALDGNAQAKAFFATLNSANRYAIHFRLQTAKKAETRARRIEQFIKMLENNEKLHP